MAIVFELWAETRDESSLQSFTEHFVNHSFTMINGRTIRCTATREPDNPLGINIYPEGLSSYGIRTLNDALEATEIGLLLCKHLKTAPNFSFARVDWEAQNIPMADLDRYVEISPDGSRRLWLPCVVDEHLYRQLGSPQPLDVFREGYWWYRYRGESYTPLYSNDQAELNDLCRRLFPGEYFKY